MQHAQVLKQIQNIAKWFAEHMLDMKSKNFIC